MHSVVFLLIAIAVGVSTGLGSAYLAVQEFGGFHAIRSNGWIARPGSGSPDADPYEQARRTRSHHIPLGTGEGLTFQADRDGAGEPLLGTCDYVISGRSLPARLWTLTVLDQNGQPIANPSARYGMHSREMLFNKDNTFRLSLSRRPKSGNWLPTGTAPALTLVIHLYDSPVASGSDLAEVTMPVIEKGDCQ